MGQLIWRGRMGRNVIVDAVSEMCRLRSITHIMMSPNTFQLYSAGIQAHHVKAGIRRGSCHAVGIIIVEGLTDECMFTFNFRRARAAKELLCLARAEEYDKAIDLLDALMDRGAKWIHVGSTPGEIDDEVAGE